MSRYDATVPLPSHPTHMALAPEPPEVAVGEVAVREAQQPRVDRELDAARRDDRAREVAARPLLDRDGAPPVRDDRAFVLDLRQCARPSS